MATMTGSSSSNSSNRNLPPEPSSAELDPRRRGLDVVAAEFLALFLGEPPEMGDAPPGQRMGRVELDRAAPRDCSQSNSMASATEPPLCFRALADQVRAPFAFLHIDDAEMARAAQQALRGLGVFHLDDAIGDLHQRAREMLRLDSRRREGIGEIFARAAEIEQQIDADVIADQRRDADDGALALLLAAAATAAHHRRIDLIEDLHQHPRHRHQDEIAIDDMAELVRRRPRAASSSFRNSKMPCVTTMRALERNSP